MSMDFDRFLFSLTHVLTKEKEGGRTTGSRNTALCSDGGAAGIAHLKPNQLGG